MTKIFILVVHTKLTFNLVYNDLKRLICAKPIYFQGGNRDSCRNKIKITRGGLVFQSSRISRRCFSFILISRIVWSILLIFLNDQRSLFEYSYFSLKWYFTPEKPPDFLATNRNPNNLALFLG